MDPGQYREIGGYAKRLDVFVVANGSGNGKVAVSSVSTTPKWNRNKPMVLGNMYVYYW